MDNSDKNCLPYNSDALCKTDFIKSEKYTFMWSISDFSKRPEKCGELITSEEFSLKGPDDKITKWFAEVYPRGIKEGCVDFVSVYLTKQTVLEEVDAHCVLYSLGVNGVKEKIVELNDVRKFDVGENKGWGWDKAIKRSDLHAPDDIRTLFLEITIFGKTKKSIEFANTGIRCVAFNENFHHKQLAHDFEALFLSKDQSDIKIKCGEKVFDCHKIILTSRSLVFKSMIESDMKEKVNGEVEIKNMDHDVLEDLLKYIYSGVAPSIDALAQGLLAAADQYHLEQLKELCELKLCSRLDISNCIALLILGDLHSAPKLKAASLEFVSKNMQKMKTSEWKQSLIAYPALVLEVMERLLPKNVDENDTTEMKKRAAF